MLVAIAEAARSTDPSVYAQIPESLRASKTLILCPPTLIDNWWDELLTWSPDEVLGDFRKVDSSVKSVEERLRIISAWYHDGGILVIGYDMFRILIQNNSTAKRAAPLSESQHSEAEKYLLHGPNIIVADEAHKMKNADSAVTKSAVRFRSTSRIALTGSPLANNVEEYHTMIDWVAPNYLGPAKEFRAKYVEPIQLGLWHDSTAYERRRSLKMLGVLKADLDPKVHRADISVLRNDLPPKTEFVITVPLTDLQSKAYSIYVQEMVNRGSYATTKDGEIAQTTIWHWLAILSLLCNHPLCFNRKLHERKDEAKNDLGAKHKAVVVSQDNTDQEEVIAAELNEPIWKVGVSETLVAAVAKLFESEGSQLNAIHLSNKVTVLCQILDASKAAGDKVLVFSQSIPTLDYLAQMCHSQGRKIARLDGKTPTSTRQDGVKKFNAGATEIFLISTNAGGLGLNLPSANRVVIFDFKWNPISEEQAVGRAYRIGQTKPVFVYRFIAGGTFENSIHNKTIFKMQLASRVVDKKNPIARASRKISDFLFEPKNVEQMDLSEFEGVDPDVLDKILATQSQKSTIRAIVQSDTFERDDDDKLTPQEQQEVNQILSETSFKRRDPQGYKAMLAKRINISQGLPRPPIQPSKEFQHYQGPPRSAPTNSTVDASSIMAAPTPIPGSVQHTKIGPTQQMNGMKPSSANSPMQPATGTHPGAAVTEEAPKTDPQTSNNPVRGRSPLHSGPIMETSALAFLSAPVLDPITGANTKFSPESPGGEYSASVEQGLTGRPKNVTPPPGRSRLASMSPLGMTKSRRGYSRRIFEIVKTALASNATPPDSSPLVFGKGHAAAAGRVSADIMEYLAKYTKDRESKSVAYNALVAALEADPEKCKELVTTKWSSKEFVKCFIKDLVDPNETSTGDDMKGIQNVRNSNISIPPVNGVTPRVEAKPPKQNESADLTVQRSFELYSDKELEEHFHSLDLVTYGRGADTIARNQATQSAQNIANPESIVAAEEVVASENQKEPQSQGVAPTMAASLQPPLSPHSICGDELSLPASSLVSLD